ncbi:Alpha/Beta hydrolase protein [Pyronema domesticum]|nr:Alpha/Beta hydrolase protein [Pyronema domesticum]
MLGTSFGSLVFIRICIWFLSSITPAAVAYLVYAITTGKTTNYLILEAYCAAETAFYFVYYLPRKRNLQRPASHPPRHPYSHRQALFQKCLSTISDPKSYISGWFHGAPYTSVYRENLAEFLAWGFLDRDTLPEKGSEDWEELEGYVDATEKAMGLELKPGYNPEVKALRLTVDPVRMTHRSLAWYLMISVVDLLTSAGLYFRGFRLLPTSGWYQIFPLRFHAPLMSLGIASPAKDLSYWFKPHRSPTSLPVVFLHGLGVGLYPYVPFLGELSASLGPDTGLIVIEIMPISTRICHDPTSIPEFNRQILQILSFHGIDKFILAGHSYGTILSTHLLAHPHIREKIEGVVLIDPISFLLHLPDVAYNFTARTPRGANERQLEYFASRDPGISGTICRHFFWGRNVLWKEDLMGGDEIPGVKAAVALGWRDLIVNIPAVWEYLNDGDERVESNGQARDRDQEMTDATVTTKEGIRLLRYGDCDHAQVFDTKERRKRIVDVVVEFSRGGGKKAE